MLYSKKISLIIPCKNEEAALYSLLEKVPRFIDEIIVVDNNSTDNTYRVAKVAGVKVIKERKHIDGVGYGFAHRTGMKKATGDYIVAMDGDDTYPTQSIQDVIKYMEKNNFDFVSCSRLPLSNSHTITFIRQLGIRILNIWTTIIYGYYFNDILTGMWAMKKEIINKLNIRSGDWNLSPEIKLAALYNTDIRFSEYHIPYFLRINGMSKLNTWKTGLNHMFFILKRRLTVDVNINKYPLRNYAFRAINVAKSAIAFLIFNNR